MADNFQDVFASDSEDSDFGGFEPVDLENADIVDVNNVELDDNDLDDILGEIEQEERDVFFEAYDSEWLQNFQTPSGPVNIEDETSPYDIFRMIFDDEVFDYLVQQTNLYYEQFLLAKGGIDNLPNHSRFRSWVPVNRDELKVFFAVILYQGLVRLPTYELYWSTHDLLQFRNLTTYMTRDRFLNILSFLHARDNSAEPPRDSPDYDPGYKVSYIAAKLVKNWQKLYKPKREVSIDETLVPYKGRTKILQYIPSKPHKWGLKVWTLADSKSGYVWNWQLYTGKITLQNGRGAAHEVVMSLMDPLLNLGHHLYCDNYFTSPSLFTDLGDNQTGACGTLRTNRIGVPRQVYIVIYVLYIYKNVS